MHSPRPDDGRPQSVPETNVGRLAATIERLRAEVRQAQLAAEGRALIEVAKGILIERLRCSVADAAQQLAHLAEQAGVTQLELAADIINQAAQDRISETARAFLAATQAEEPSREAADLSVRLRSAESGALRAGDSQAVAESLLEHALTPLGASAVAIWEANPDASLTLAGYAGLSDEEARRWRYVPPGVETPARRALVNRQSVWLRSLSAAGLPSIGQREISGGRVTVPAGTGGQIFAVLEVAWPEPLPPQPPQIRKQIEALAELSAYTFDAPTRSGGPHHPQAVSELVALIDTLPDTALMLRPHLDDEGRLRDFRIQHANARFADPAGRPRHMVVGSLLLEAYPLAAGDGGLWDKIERVHATGEPFHADKLAMTALVDQVPLTSIASVSITRHRDSVLLVWRLHDEATQLASLLQHAQRLGRIGGFEENIVTGRIIWNSQLYALYGLEEGDPPIPLERLADHAHPDDAVAIGRFLRTVLHQRRPGSTAFRLRRSDGIARHIRVVAEPEFDADGRPLTIRGAYQDISSQHWTEVALAATRDQLAHTEQQAAERNRLTLQLQQAIMPPSQEPMEAFDLNIAVRYRPAEKEHLVGGDWYDAVVLPTKQILLSVGDVAGHGIEAATGMVVLRNALRGLAATGAGPGQLLSWLNLVAHYLTDQVTATAILGLYDPETRVLRWARAGHLPPILIREGRVEELDLIDGLLLGALSDATYDEGRLELASDDILLMYTDGLIERRDRTLDHSQGQLLRMAAHPIANLEHRLDHLLTHSSSDTDDDTCIVGIQLR
ncbi:SpoIIE family protein phosphatase [Nonomuraea sp. MCN248]|uniref:SpoIIE family protein phosphatase n=1 Tax=Nonomuraea corallina TaxID=2989783 RepID=A0ABT4SJF9_9ACTN|nr:SpoIIE family protein phosphatase [Nonomuraea corallina]MDA0637334.1 SpoIIE family protein phosphatase [Nonomuraea corallina]